jgi:hypothetical protein
MGAKQAFIVTANAGYSLSSTVGGNCPAGGWNGGTYTTGAVTANCTISFSAVAIVSNYTVAPSGSNVSINPNVPQSVAANGRASFAVAANSGFVLSTAVEGSCPQGSWNGGVYTTGAITASCTLSFSAKGSAAHHVGVYNINGKNGVIIDGDTFTSSNSVCISISNSSNITIKNISAIHCYGVGVAINNSSNITIQNSYFEDLNGGVYAVNSSVIKVNSNRFKNVGRAGKLDGSRGQFVQFNNVNGAGNEINLNRGVNIPGQSTPEDLVSLFETKGTAASPVQIKGNCFQGGGPSGSGGGIMSGDYGGAYAIVEGNTLVDPGQYGIAVASGTNIQLLNNKIYGKKQSFTNIGMYIWNQTTTACSNITVSGNSVDFTNSSGAKNNFWDAGNCNPIIYGDNNFDANLSALHCSID